MNLQLSKFTAKQQNVAANTLADFVKGALAQGFEPKVPKGHKSGLVFLSKAGNPQVMFMNKANERVYVRVSANLWEAIQQKEVTDFRQNPVYLTELDNGGSMLVIGMAAEAQEFESVDFSKAVAFVVTEEQ